MTTPKSPTLRLLILGGYGVFGARLIELLADEARLHIIVAGRSLAKAETLCARYRGRAQLEPMVLDRDHADVHLPRLQCDVVIDASGPFQDYGADRYRVIRACIARGIHYLDFADAADFVDGVSQFDELARRSEVFVLSGVSSFPVLTAAALDAMAETMTITRVEGGIAPSPYAGIGMNVMRAVAGYAGSPVPLVRNGRVTTAVGLGESRRYTVAVPGKMPLRNLRFSLVDVPDLLILPREQPSIVELWMGAGPVPESLHRILNLLSLARARFKLPSYEPLSPLFYAILNRMRFGEHRGGMYVQATGVREGRPVTRSWHMIAEGDDGPYIPSMAIEIILRKMLDGTIPAIGARPAVHALDLDDYAEAFRGRQITAGFRDQTPARNLYRQILGEAFDALPPSLRAMHDGPVTEWVGTTTIRRGSGPIRGALAALLGFPKSGRNIPTTVIFHRDGLRERWERRFGSKTVSSTQVPGTGRMLHLIMERFGPVTCAVALVLDGNRLYFVPRHWWLFGIPMPRWLLPGGESQESCLDDSMAFDIKIALPILGTLVSYRGVLKPNRDVTKESRHQESKAMLR